MVSLPPSPQASAPSPLLGNSADTQADSLYHRAPRATSGSQCPRHEQRAVLRICRLDAPTNSSKGAPLHDRPNARCYRSVLDEFRKRVESRRQWLTA